MIKLRLGVAIMVGLFPGTVIAQSCAGVEGRVNARTSQLTAAVTSAIATATTTYTAQQIVERQLIMSSLRVLAEQKDVSLDQEVSAQQAAAKALGQTIVEESVTSQIADAAEEFGHTGYGACDLIVEGVALRTARDTARTASADIHNTVIANYGIQTQAEHDAAVEDWSNLAQTATTVTATDVLEGDQAAAEQFARLVLGPPSPPIGGGGTASGLETIVRMQDTSRRSVVTKVIADIAADRLITDQMESISDTWLGDDGGEEWSATLAAGPGRAALLDLTRIEAANITASAMELRKKFREEFALSTFALSYTDRRLGDWQGLGGRP
ncbi:hypothetical protein [Phaeobacter piscinae]|uniref:hypothetical protein n=1 Tax=Phaeobacter piscinae TaxID=1580596 RepID=UPI00058F18F8|nr:hypothetical protein [Phaeobacter piscinae]UTS82780.1 hypothetical protein OL67_003890 [Phaeobacter piscinae]